MRQQTSSVASRLRAAWGSVTPKAEHEQEAEAAPVEDFAARLREAVRAGQH